MKTNNTKYDFPVHHLPCPVEYIAGVWRFIRPPFFKYLCYSLPGHLIHFIKEVAYTLRINNLTYNVKAGDTIYYYGSEEVETIGDSTEVVFYSVGFEASKLSPLPIDKRVFKADTKTSKLFEELYDTFSYGASNRYHNFRIYSLLLAILDNIEGFYQDTRHADETEDLWWALETRVRRNKMFRMSLSELSKISGYSRSTVVRACNKATGLTPGKRLRKIRMEEAKGLLNFAHISITEVAEYLGYSRINEFSRDFSDFYGIPPSKMLRK